MNYLIGIDIGTQGTKTVLRNEHGVSIAESFAESRLIYRSSDSVEENTEEMIDSVLKTIKQVIQMSSVSPGKVAGICIDGQMAGVLGIGRDGYAVTPYDSWLDTRCGKYREKYIEIGEERVISITGAPVTYAHGPKILWWKYEYPEVYDEIFAFVQPAAYVTMRLCGLSGEQAFIDHTYLHFSGFADTENKCWSSELTDALGISSSKLPSIVRPFDVVGGLIPEMASKCDLLAGTPLVAGCGDTAATSFGGGVTQSGILFDVAGTASVFSCASDVYAPDIKYKTIMFAPSVIDHLYTPMAYINGGGMCLKWLRDDIAEGKYSYAELDNMAEKVSAGSGNLLFLPHFSGRTCPNDILVRGSYINLSWKHDLAHLYRAILEGISYEYRIYADIMRVLMPSLQFKHVITVGGGSKSRLFKQIKSDVLGVSVSSINLADTASLGCCAIAGYGVGLYKTMESLIESVIRTEERNIPQAEMTKEYAKRGAIYADVFNALHGIYEDLQALKK